MLEREEFLQLWKQIGNCWLQARKLMAEEDDGDPTLYILLKQVTDYLKSADNRMDDLNEEYGASQKL